MRKQLFILLLIALSSGCAHQELKAPCTDRVAALDTIPCQQRVPVNGLAFHFTQTPLAP